MCIFPYYLIILVDSVNTTSIEIQNSSITKSMALVLPLFAYTHSQPYHSSAWRSLICTPICMILSIWKCEINGIMHYMTFWPWLFHSLYCPWDPSTPLHVPTRWVALPHADGPRFAWHSPLVGPCGCCRLSAITDQAAVNREGTSFCVEIGFRFCKINASKCSYWVIG